MGPESFEFYKLVRIKNLPPCPFSVLFLPRLVLEFSIISYAFGKFPIVIWTWWAMFLSTLIFPYLLFQQWARSYSKSSYPVIYSSFYCLLFMVFQIGVLCFGPTYAILAYALPPASRIIIILEQVKFWVLPNAVLYLVKMTTATTIII